MKITFVIPDMLWLYNYKEQFSLGILYLSTVLKAEGCEVDIYDTNVHPIEEIPHADVYGFSTVHGTYESCVDLAKAIKDIYPGSQRIVGGVYASLSPMDIDPVFDSVFVGEAEASIVKYIKHLRSGHPLAFYPAQKDVCIDELVPDRSLLPDDYVRTPSIFTKGHKYDEHGSTSIMFSRGCPYNCAFCASPGLYKHRVRYRAVQGIVEEVQGIIDTYGIRQFRVQDDTFTAKPSYFVELAKALEPLEIFYRCSTRANHVTEETAQWLWRSGCREVGLGIEVADDEALQKLNKGMTVEQMENAIHILKAQGIVVRSFFMLGLPFDSPETIQANIDFIERTGIDNIMASNFIPFPGTEMHRHQDRFNIKSIKTDGFTCLSFASHIPLAPNILRMDMGEQEHIEIMRVFYNYMMKKGYIH